MIANVPVILIVLVCIGFQVLKGRLTKSFVNLVVALIAGVIAFNYFEVLAEVFLSRSGNARWPAVIPWTQTLSFSFLFVFAFAALRGGISKLLNNDIEFSMLVERIGRGVCGFFLGLFLSGILLTAVMMSPFQYERFSGTNPDPDQPNTSFLNADGFATGLFSLFSKGSMSGGKSFAVVHPDYLDQLAMNRLNDSGNIKVFTTRNIIDVPSEKAVWPGPENLSSETGSPIQPEPDAELMIVRVGISKSALSGGAFSFTPSQLRIIVKPDGENGRGLSGTGRNVYPVGYFSGPGQVATPSLRQTITLRSDDFEKNVKWIDFLFSVPLNHTPVLVELKQNNIAELPAETKAEEAPALEYFRKSSGEEAAAEESDSG
jgi:hypothetical protein